MSLIRITLDLAIPKDIYDALPSAQKAAFAKEVKGLKEYAVKIKGAVEEPTIKATIHVCRHDEGLPCEPERDI